MEGWVGKGWSARSRVARRRGHRSSWRTVVLVTCLVVGAGLPHCDTHAQIPVTDGSALLQRGVGLSSTLSHYGSTIAHYGAVVKQHVLDVAHYKSVIEHYAQQAVSLQGLAKINLNSLAVPPTLAQLTESERQEHVSRACPKPGGLPSVRKLLTMVVPKLSEPIAIQQQDICERIAGLRVDKFNKTIRMIDRLRIFQENARELAETLKELGSKQGDMDGFKGVVAANQSMLEVEMQGWHAQIEADDQVLSYLEHEQGDLGRLAMRGSSTFTGKLIQVGALKVALQAL